MHGEERAIYVAMILTGLLPVAGALVRGGAIGAGVTLCMLMIAAGVIGLVRGRARAALPRARIVCYRARARARARL